MPRRGFIPKREVLPDPVYNTTVITKLINQIMYDGKRGVAQSVCYEALEAVAEKSGKEAMEVFNAAMANIMPSLEVKATRTAPTPTFWSVRFFLPPWRTTSAPSPRRMARFFSATTCCWKRRQRSGRATA